MWKSNMRNILLRYFFTSLFSESFSRLLHNLHVVAHEGCHAVCEHVAAVSIDNSSRCPKTLRSTTGLSSLLIYNLTARVDCITPCERFQSHPRVGWRRHCSWRTREDEHIWAERSEEETVTRRRRRRRISTGNSLRATGTSTLHFWVRLLD